MKIRVNEREVEVGAEVTAGELRRREKPDADVVIVNGFPASPELLLRSGDEVVLIRKGEVPREDEMEALLVARHTPGVHRLLKRGRVGIAGLGGLGSAVALALARTGVGRLVLADGDVVEPSNLNRQQFFVDQLGRPKCEALRENILRAHPFTDLRTHHLELTSENTGSVFSGVQVVVEAFDRAEAKRMLVDTVLTKMEGVAVVAASGVAGCGPANGIVTRRRARNLYIVGDEESEARPGEGLMAPRVGVAAHHQANAVIRLLLGEDPVAEGEAGAARAQPPAP